MNNIVRSARKVLKRVPEKLEVVEKNFNFYHVTTKCWRGRIGRDSLFFASKPAGYRVQLYGDESCEIWLERIDKDRVEVSERVEKTATCCRCDGPLDDRACAEFGACEDCIDDADNDPEGVLLDLLQRR